MAGARISEAPRPRSDWKAAFLTQQLKTPAIRRLFGLQIHEKANLRKMRADFPCVCDGSELAEVPPVCVMRLKAGWSIMRFRGHTYADRSAEEAFHR